jgi:hypothetical protein
VPGAIDSKPVAYQEEEKKQWKVAAAALSE